MHETSVSISTTQLRSIWAAGGELIRGGGGKTASLLLYSPFDIFIAD